MNLQNSNSLSTFLPDNITKHRGIRVFIIAHFPIPCISNEHKQTRLNIKTENHTKVAVLKILKPAVKS